MPYFVKKNTRYLQLECTEGTAPLLEVKTNNAPRLAAGLRLTCLPLADKTTAMSVKAGGIHTALFGQITPYVNRQPSTVVIPHYILNTISFVSTIQ
jgi:hypothetical protein